MVSIYVTLLQFFYPRANDTFGTPYEGWLRSTWSISAGRGSLKSCYGLKLCLMLAENAVLCQRKYDGFLCYFFYLIITISFQINIKVLLIFSLELNPATRALDGVNKNCLKTRKALKIQSNGLGPLSVGTWKSFNAQEMSKIYFSRHIDQTANLLADT